MVRALQTQAGGRRRFAGPREGPQAPAERTWDKPQFYPPHVFLELCGLRDWIEKQAGRDAPIFEALLLVFSSIVVKASRQLLGEPTQHPTIGRSRLAGSAAGSSPRPAKWRVCTPRCGQSAGPAAGRDQGTSALCVGDARSVLSDPEALPLWAGSVDCIVTSPPYLGTYDYVDHRATLSLARHRSRANRPRRNGCPSS